MENRIEYGTHCESISVKNDKHERLILRKVGDYVNALTTISSVITLSDVDALALCNFLIDKFKLEIKK